MVVNRSRQSLLQHFDASLLWGQEIIGQVQLLVVVNAAGSSWLGSDCCLVVLLIHLNFLWMSGQMNRGPCLLCFHWKIVERMPLAISAEGTGLCIRFHAGLPFNHDSHSQKKITQLTRTTQQRRSLTNIWSGLLLNLAVLNLQIIKWISTNKI